MREEEMNLRGEPQRPTDNREVGSDMGDVVRQKTRTTTERPLIKSSMDVESEQSELERSIQPLEDIVNTGELLDDNKLIRDTDRVRPEDIADVVSKPIIPTKSAPPVIDSNNEFFTEEDKARLILEEDKRRTISNQRRLDFENAFLEEQERRVQFDEKIKIMKAEFELYLKNTFPEFVGNRNMTDGDKQKNQADIKRKKEENSTKVKELQKKKIERLEREKERKLVESQLRLNKLTEGEVQTFFEEEIIIEQKEKIAQNPQIENLNPIQKQIREIEEMEIRMGRPIVPHRDIVESEESDFDSNSMTKSTDILIRPMNVEEEFNKRQKENRLEILRNELNSNQRSEEDYVSTLK
jgi:hypothetical protein